MTDIHTLDNGLTLILHPIPTALTAACGYFVNVGARDELPEQMGVSHFVEHLMFKGTEQYSADEINQAFDAMGANYNAWTSHEMTAYHAQVLPEFLPDAMRYFAAMLRPALREDDVNMERQVVLEEIKMYDDRPEWRMQDQMMALHFGNHGLGHRVLGTKDTVSGLTPAQIRQWIESSYGADRTVLVVTGKFDKEEIYQHAVQLTSEWQSSELKPTRPAPDRMQNEPVVWYDNKATRAYINICIDAPEARSDSRAALQLLSYILGGSDTSRLYWELIEKGVVDDAGSQWSGHDGCGSFYLWATCDPGKEDEIILTLWKTLRQLGQPGNLGAEELQRACNRMATALTLQEERSNGMMQSMGASWWTLGKLVTLQERLDAFAAVTPVDVQRLAVILSEAAFTQAILRPEEAAC